MIRAEIGAMHLLRMLLAGLVAAMALVSSASAQFFETSSLRVNYADFYTPQVYVSQPSGFESVNSRQYGSYSPTNDTQISFVRLTDDVDDDLIAGAALFVDNNGNPMFLITDFDDLHEFNIVFDGSAESQVFRSQAIDVMYVTWMTDQTQLKEQEENRRIVTRLAHSLQSPPSENGLRAQVISSASTESSIWAHASDTFVPDDSLPEKPEGWALLVGIRAIQTEDRSDVLFSGGIMGTTDRNTDAANDVVGPQAGLMWRRSRGPWTVRLQGTALAGYNFGNIRQSGTVVPEFIPGARNRPLYSEPSSYSYYDSASRFSPSGELLAETTWQLTDALALRLWWSGLVVENVVFTDDRVVDALPNFGLRDPGNQRLFVHNLFCGLEYVR